MGGTLPVVAEDGGSSPSLPTLLDLFCGAGGSAAGYARAGFRVIGVDVEPQPHYPYEFVQADATEFDLSGFDVLTASPPCQGHSHLASSPWVDRGSAWMLGHTVARFMGTDRPWVIENVAAAPMPRAVPWVARYCGSSFGLAVRRHRLFASNVRLEAPPCDHRAQGQPLGVYGNGGGMDRGKGLKASRAQAPAAMGIDWMTHAELVQAIPPAYTEHIGAQLLGAPDLKGNPCPIPNGMTFALRCVAASALST